MHFTVLGASRFGVATVRQLLKEGHEVVLIDHDRARLDALADDLDCGFICGDGTLPSTLRDAFGDGSDALISLTNEDDVNILASVVGRSIGYDRVIPQIVRSELLSIVEELDLDDTITPHESVASSIVSALTQHSEVETEMTLHRQMRIVTQKVPKQMAGKTIGEIDLPDGTRPIAHICPEGETLADEDKSLEEGDKLVIVTAMDATDALNKIFKSD